MKPVLIPIALAAAAAAFAPGAAAQSSVTLYGHLNVTIEAQKNGPTRDRGIFDNGSRIGFKGIEDLGGGLRAGFALESGMDLSTGAPSSAAFWGRQSEAWLAGSFGTVRVGNFIPQSYYAITDLTSLHNHNEGSSRDAFYFDPNIMFNGQANKIAYRTPAMLDGRLWAEASVQEAGGLGERGYDAALTYVGGDWRFGAGYSQAGDLDQWGVSALYQITTDLRLGGYFQRASRLDQQGAYRVYSGSRNSGRLALQYTMGATELHANFGYADNIGGLRKTNAQQYTLAINQNLSKRTKVYVFYNYLGNDDVLQAYTLGNFTSMALGVRHDF